MKKRYVNLGTALVLSAVMTMGSPVATMAQGWKMDNMGWWYENQDHTYTREGFQLISGSWYYFDAAGYMKTGWLYHTDGNWYYLNGSGLMVTGWNQIGGNWYYFNGSGAMVTGWNQIGGNWYYLDGSGAMVTGWNQIGGNWYYFDNSGAMAADQWIGQCYVDETGAWVEQVEVCDVKFERNYESETSKEYAVVQGVDQAGNVVWEYETGKYGAYQLDRVSDLGMVDDIYYLAEGGTIKAFQVKDGKLLWENDEFKGDSAKMTHNGNGTIFVNGYYGPDFHAIDKNGKTLFRKEYFSEKYVWPFIFTYSNGEILIGMQKENASSEMENVLIGVDEKDFSWHVYK